jgi:hypothetical protein
MALFSTIEPKVTCPQSRLLVRMKLSPTLENEKPIYRSKALHRDFDQRFLSTNSSILRCSAPRRAFQSPVKVEIGGLILIALACDHPSAMATTSGQFDIASTSSETNSSRIMTLSRKFQLRLSLSQSIAPSVPSTSQRRCLRQPLAGRLLKSWLSGQPRSNLLLSPQRFRSRRLQSPNTR